MSCWKIFGILLRGWGFALGSEGMEKFSLVDVGCEEVDVDFW